MSETGVSSNQKKFDSQFKTIRMRASGKQNPRAA